MKKCIVLLSTLMSIGILNAQQLGEQNVTATIDLQPILQLSTQTKTIEFSFDDYTDYAAGVTQYGATTLKVTSTVNWDLYAIGTSSGNVGNGYWDNLATYGNQQPKSTNKIPLSALEIRQSTPNQNAAGASGMYKDYSSPFPSSANPAGSNSIYVDPNHAGTPPKNMHKYIAGHAGTTSTGVDAVVGGSYLNQQNQLSQYYFNIDYRIVPGVPAVFPMAFDASGTIPQNLVQANGEGYYAQPGMYSMAVQYVLLEDQ